MKEDYVVMEKHRKIFSTTAVIIGAFVFIICLVVWILRMTDRIFDAGTFMVGLIALAITIMGFKETSFRWVESKEVNDNYKVVKKGEK